MPAGGTWERLEHWFEAPVLATDELTQQARTLWIIAWGTFAFAALSLVVLWTLEGGRGGEYALAVGVRLAFTLAAHELNRRGHTRIASWWLVIRARRRRCRPLTLGLPGIMLVDDSGLELPGEGAAVT